MRTWENTFQTLFTQSFSNEENKKWKFTVELDKNTNELIMNVRQFVSTNKYTGPTKNGFFCRFSSVEDIESLEQMFNSLFKQLHQIAKS